jgi:hypothetical protein
MKEPKFYNEDGSLTGYALACGYVEKQETEQGKKQMFMEHNHIHVKHHKFTETTISNELWETFSSNELTKARKLYKSIKV